MSISGSGISCDGLGNAAAEAKCREAVDACNAFMAPGAQAECQKQVAVCVGGARAKASSFQLMMPNGGSVEVSSPESCFATSVRIARAFWPEGAPPAPAPAAVSAEAPRPVEISVLPASGVDNPEQCKGVC